MLTICNLGILGLRENITANWQHPAIQGVSKKVAPIKLFGIFSLWLSLFA